MKKIILEPYNRLWAIEFEALKQKLHPVLGRIAVTIEHVGSTAVIGLSAKPIIDCDIVVAPSDIIEGITLLESIGYIHKGDQGIPQREAFTAPADSAYPHHLYLCPIGNLALQNHLAIRDYLRENPESAEVYGELKRSLATQHPHDMDAYIAGKSSFLADILQKQGFSPEDVQEIEEINDR